MSASTGGLRWHTTAGEQVSPKNPMRWHSPLWGTGEEHVLGRPGWGQDQVPPLMSWFRAPSSPERFL